MTERTPEAYAAAFERERRNEYPIIDALEARLGYAVDRERLEAAARVLACPVKKNPPNWQHGRVIYAICRKLMAERDISQLWIDIGTAKGFSACCMAWALSDANRLAAIWSFDVISPNSTEPRNSVVDGEWIKGIHSYVGPFLPETVCPSFLDANLLEDYLDLDAARNIGFAFIDGSHTYEGVKADIKTVAPRQQSGDIILFDDVNKSEVNRAVTELEGYDLEYIRLLPKRAYAIAVKQ